MNKFKTLNEEIDRIKELSGIEKKESTQLIDESGFARINRMLWGGVPSINSVGILTAENPQGQQLSPEENNKRMKDLKTTLGTYGFIDVKGKFRTKEGNNLIENSLIIPNLPKETLFWLQKKFEQESVIYGKRKDKNTFLFEYIKNGNTEDKQEVILSKMEGNEEYYSYLPKTSKKDGEKIKYERSFRIPFFDKIGYRKSTNQGTWEITEHYGFLDMNLEDLPKDNKEINLLLNEIKKNEKELLIEGLISKYYWVRRGIINESIKIIKEILDQLENGFINIDIDNLPKGNEEVLILLKNIRENKKRLIVNDSLSNDYIGKKHEINESIRRLKELIKENKIFKLTEEQLEEITKDQEIYNYFLINDKPFIHATAEQHYNQSKEKSLELFNHIPKNFKQFCFEEYERNK